MLQLALSRVSQPALPGEGDGSWQNKTRFQSALNNQGSDTPVRLVNAKLYERSKLTKKSNGIIQSGLPTVNNVDGKEQNARHLAGIRSDDWFGQL